jgi:hypothetical protein
MPDVHLTAILSHPYISKLKPEATQILLQQALHDHPSPLLELSHTGYHVRRRSSTYPAPFVPANSFDITDDDGLAFWDQRTIYVEPHLRNICPQPARVVQWLADHGALKSKWLPVQAVHTLWNSCAFVVLSGSVMHEGTWSKWRETGKPEDWKIMTKVEHTKRTAEYCALLEKENPRGMRRVEEDVSVLPQIARPAALPVACQPLADVQSGHGEEVGSGKRKRKNLDALPLVLLGTMISRRRPSLLSTTTKMSSTSQIQPWWTRMRQSLWTRSPVRTYSKHKEAKENAKRGRAASQTTAEHVGPTDIAPAAGTVDAVQPSKKHRR